MASDVLLVVATAAAILPVILRIIVMWWLKDWRWLFLFWIEQHGALIGASVKTKNATPRQQENCMPKIPLIDVLLLKSEREVFYI